MKALLVIDVQNGIVNAGNFEEELSLMEKVIKDFKAKELPVIFMKHFDEAEENRYTKIQKALTCIHH